MEQTLRRKTCKLWEFLISPLKQKRLSGERKRTNQPIWGEIGPRVVRGKKKSRE